MRVLYLAWQDPEERRWYPVGRLTRGDGAYYFVYVRGAQECRGFRPFLRMEDLSVEYRSEELFPVFANRLLLKSRPDHKDFLEWLNVPPDENDPFVLLGRSGGTRETDHFIVFPCPEKTIDGNYHVHFFAHGIRYLPALAIEQVNTLSARTRLFLMPDPQNESDTLAIALRTGKPVTIVGFVPRFLTEDFHSMLKATQPHTREVKVEVEKVHLRAPIQMRLLCNITAPWPEDFPPCSGDLFEPLAGTRSIEHLAVPSR